MKDCARPLALLKWGEGSAFLHDEILSRRQRQGDTDIDEVQGEHTVTQRLGHLPVGPVNNENDSADHHQKYEKRHEETIGGDRDSTVAVVYGCDNAEGQPWKGQTESHVENIGSNGRRHGHVTLSLLCDNH